MLVKRLMSCQTAPPSYVIGKHIFLREILNYTLAAIEIAIIYPLAWH